MKLLWLLVVVVLSVACTATPTQVGVDASTDAPTTPVPLDSYPAPGAAQNAQATDYPAESFETVLAPTATADPTLGIVKGVLLLQGKPVPQADLYIADLYKSEDGKDVAYGFSQGSSPRTVTNEKGEFEFRNVPQGTHSLMLDLVVQSYLLLKPNTQEAMKFDIGPGTVIDLGVLDYEELPLP